MRKNSSFANRRPYRSLLTLLLLAALLGGSLFAGVRLTRIFAVATPTVVLDKSSGPVGTVVSLSATNFPATDADHTAPVTFDSTQIDSRGMILCTGSDYSGFGPACLPSDPATTYTIPTGTSPGAHQFCVTVSFLSTHDQACATFTVAGPTSTPTTVPTSTPTSIPPTSTPTSVPTTVVPTDTPTSTPPETPTNTAVATNTPVSSPTPTNTTVPTAAPTLVPTPGTLPTEPACKNSGQPPQTTEDGHYVGGATVQLNPQQLPPNTSVVLLYVGPRWRIQGSDTERLLYSAMLGQTGAVSRHGHTGVFSTGRQGTLAPTIQLPSDTAYGTATVTAFTRDLVNGRQTGQHKPVASWTIPVTTHDSELEIQGDPGQYVVVDPADKSKSTGPCGTVLGSNGVSGIVDPSPAGGADEISYMGDGAVQHLTVIGFAGSKTGIDVKPTAHPPVSCDLRKSYNVSVWDNKGGLFSELSGIGPLGYFLSGVHINDPLTISVSTPDGGPLPQGQTVKVELIGADEKTYLSRTLNFDPAVSHAAGLDFVSNLGQEQNASQIYGGSGGSARGSKKPSSAGTAANRPPDAQQLVAQMPESVFTIKDFDPGLLPPSGGNVFVTIGDCSAIVPIKIVDPYWSSTTSFAPSFITFDGQQRTYHMIGSMPPQPLDWSDPVSVGWDSYGPLPAWSHDFQNEAKAGISLDEYFSTGGRWTASAQAQALLTIIDHKLVDNRYNLVTVYHNPGRPGYVVADQPLFYWNFGPYTLAEVPLAAIGVDDVYIGLTFKVQFGAHLTARWRAEILNTLQLDRVTITGDAGMTLKAAVSLSIGVASADAGIQGDLDLTVPVTLSADRTDVSWCLTGAISLYIGYDLAGSSGYLFGTPIQLASVHVGPCTSYLARATAPLDIERTVMEGPPRAPVHHIQTPLAPRIPQSHPRPSVSFDSHGRGMSVWVRQDSKVRRDFLMAATSRGSGWHHPVAIASSGAILRPQVTELGDGRAVVAYMRGDFSRGDLSRLKALQKKGNPKNILDFVASRQEMYAAVYKNGRWAKPQRLTRDKIADHDPTLSADTASHTAMLIWSRGNNHTKSALVTRRFASGKWSRLSSIGLSRGGFPRRAALAFGPSHHWTVAWVSGSLAKGRIRMARLNGRAWSLINSPNIGGNVQEVTLARSGSRLALAVSVLPASGNRIIVQEPSIWGATSQGNGWRVQKISSQGDAPRLTPGTGGPAILVFRLPQNGGDVGGVSQIADAVALPQGGFSRAGLITGEGYAAAEPGAAIDPRKHTLRLLYQRLSVSSAQGVVPESNWQWAIKPKSTSIDSVNGVRAASVKISAKPILDLASARLDIAHPAPGSQVKLSVPLRNTGLSAGSATGTLKVTAAAKQISQMQIRKRRLNPNALTTLALTFRATSEAIKLSAKGLKATAGPDLGLPLEPELLVASLNVNGDMELRWQPAADHDITEFRIYRNDGAGFSLIGIAKPNDDPSQHLFVDPKSAGGSGKATYAVTAIDAQGRESDLSLAGDASHPAPHPLAGKTTGS